MSVTVHVTQLFEAPGPGMFDRCDALMDALMDAEMRGDGICDAAISADAERGIVEVEVSATGVDEDDAVRTAMEQILAAAREVVPVRIDDDPTVQLARRGRALATPIPA